MQYWTEGSQILEDCGIAFLRVGVSRSVNELSFAKPAAPLILRDLLDRRHNETPSSTLF
jgi:hypothetical protein